MSNIVYPQRALPRKYMLPILYLAERMTTTDGNVNQKEKRIVEELASAVNMKDFRHDRSYRSLTDDAACSALDIDTAKQGALVVMTLVLKADYERADAEHAFFHKIRETLDTSPVTVPVDLDSHKELALKYLR